MVLNYAQTLDGAALPLGVSITDLMVVDLGGGPVVHVLGGNGLSALSMASGGALGVLSQLAHSESLTPGVRPELVRGGGTSLYVAGADPQQGGMSLSSNGAYGSSFGLSGLSAPLAAPTRVDVGGTPMIVSARSGGGLTVHRDNGGASLTLLSELPAAGDSALTAIGATAAAQMGGQDFIYAASTTGHAVTAFRLAGDGTLTETGRIESASGLGLSYPSELATMVVSGRTFVLAGSPGSSALSVFQADANGGLTLADHVIDTLGTRFAGIAALATLSVGGFGYVAAGGADDGLSLFQLLPTGRLVHLAHFENTVAATLTNTDAIAMTTAGGNLQIVAAGAGETGVTRLTSPVSDQGLVVDGGGGDETLTGGGGRDLLTGRGGDDRISGGGGRDILSDGAGQDTLTGGSGADVFVLEADGAADVITDFQIGTDRLDLSMWRGFASAAQLLLTPISGGGVLRYGTETLTVLTSSGATLNAGQLQGLLHNAPDRPPFVSTTRVIFGTSGNDTLLGGQGDDTLAAGQGNDRVEGQGGNDVAFGGSGHDWLTGGDGNDSLVGSSGNDTLIAGEGRDTLFGDDGDDRLLLQNGAGVAYGGSGDDTISGFTEGDVIIGNQGNDAAWGGQGADLLYGGNGNDRLYGGTEDDMLRGGNGNDSLMGDAGADTLAGGAGNDTLAGGDGGDRLEGEGGADVLGGGAGADLIYGNAASGGVGDLGDTLRGDGGDDTLYGGGGDDKLVGGTENDTLFGGSGNDTLRGWTGNDSLNGGGGNDTLVGWSGSDRLDGRSGNDVLAGGDGADTFVFTDGFGSDRITDFDVTEPGERIDLSAVSGIRDWADLSANHLSKSGDDVLVTVDNNVLTIENTKVWQLDADDFLL